MEVSLLYRPNGGATTIPPQFSISAFAELENHTTHRKRRSRRRLSYRRQFKNGQRRAVVHGFTAGKLYLAGMAATLRAAAESCGTTVSYTRAAIVLLQAEDTRLISAVLRGVVQLLAAAKAVKSTADLIATYRRADGADKLALGTAISAEVIWDEVVTPVLGAGGAFHAAQS